MMFHPILAKANIEGLGELTLLYDILSLVLPTYTIMALFGQNVALGLTQAMVLLLVLPLAWSLTRGAWLLLRLICLAVGYLGANAGFLIVVAGIHGGPDATLYHGWPILVAGLVACLAGAIWFARLTIPLSETVTLRVQK